MKTRPFDSTAYGLMKAVMHGTAAETLAALALKPDLSWPDSEGLTALHHAVKAGKTETVMLLLAAGAPVNDKSNNSRTPLTIAAELGHLEIAGLLIAAGGGTNADETALHRAVEQRQRDMVKLLLQTGQAVDYQPMAGDRPLAIAAGTNDTHIVKLLLEAGADINARDMFNRTALHKAAYKNAQETAKLLIGLGASEAVKDIYSATPASTAQDENHANMQLLLNRAEDIRRDFTNAAKAEVDLKAHREMLAREEKLKVFGSGMPNALPVRKEPVRFKPK